jgi:translation initiation factor IF-3
MKQKDKRNFVRCNERIRISPVRVIHDGKNLGIMPTHEALNRARNLGLDLVEVSAQSRPPVCSIMEYGKFMYDKQKKEKDKQTHKKEKEICLRYVIADHDLLTKVNQVRKFLEEGIKVKVIVKFKQREKAHKDQGFLVINKLISGVEDLAVLEKAPSMEGSNIVVRLDTKKGTKHGPKGSCQETKQNT